MQKGTPKTFRPNITLFIEVYSNDLTILKNLSKHQKMNPNHAYIQIVWMDTYFFKIIIIMNQRSKQRLFASQPLSSMP